MKKAGGYALPPRIKAKKPRVFEIDFLRGVAIFLMILIHACYSFGYGPSFFSFPGGKPDWLIKMQAFFQFVFNAITQPDGSHSALYWGNTPLYVSEGYNINTNLYCLEVFFAGMFMFLSGVSCSFSRSNLKRGVQLAFVSSFLTIAIELADVLFGLNMHIVCGILHSLSFAIIVYAIFDRFFNEWWQHLLFVVPLLLINMAVLSLAYDSNSHMLSLNTNRIVDFGTWLDAVGALLIGRYRYGDDYFPPFLVTLALFLGGIVGKLLYKDRKSIFPDDFPTKWATPILAMGRHTIYIYVLHQVIIFLIMGIIVLSVGGKLNI